MFRDRSRSLAVVSLAATVVVWMSGLACIGSADGTASGESSERPSSEIRQFPLEGMKTSTARIGEHTFRVWLALTSDQHAEGLMHVPESEIGDDQGMLFVFPDERLHGFWMRNTITSLDIAFARANGRIVKIHTMPPLTLETFPSVEPAMFALEVKAGTFEKLGIRAGDLITIPEEVFKASP